jgi:hypothetical protein
MKQTTPLLNGRVPSSSGLIPIPRVFDQQPAPPQDHGTYGNPVPVDQAMPHEGGSQIGAAKGDVAAGLGFQFRDVVRYDVGNNRCVTAGLGALCRTPHSG